MCKLNENVSIKWVCQIKNRGVVTGMDTRNFKRGIEVSNTLVSNRPLL